MTVNWQDPPPAIHKSAQYAEHIAEMRANPGRWALIAEAAPSSTIGNINTGAIKAFQPVGHWEATGRAAGKKHGQRRFDIYCRYVGPAATSDAELLEQSILRFARDCDQRAHSFDGSPDYSDQMVRDELFEVANALRNLLDGVMSK